MKNSQTQFILNCGASKNNSLPVPMPPMQNQFTVTRVTSKNNFPPIRSRLAGALFSACLVCWCSQAAAAVLYQNYDGVTPGSGFEFISLQENTEPTPDFGGRAAVAFATDSSSYLLDSVTVNLHRNGSSAEVAMRLYSDAGGVPGSSLGLLGNPGTGTQGNYTFSGGGLPLAPSTTYWVVVEPSATPPPPDVSTEWFFGTSGSGYAKSAYVNGWGLWSIATGTPPSASIQATPVPEPSGYGLAAAVGLLAFAARRRLRRQLKNSQPSSAPPRQFYKQRRISAAAV